LPRSSTLWLGRANEARPRNSRSDRDRTSFAAFAARDTETPFRALVETEPDPRPHALVDRRLAQRRASPDVLQCQQARAGILHGVYVPWPLPGFGGLAVRERRLPIARGSAPPLLPRALSDSGEYSRCLCFLGVSVGGAERDRTRAAERHETPARRSRDEQPPTGRCLGSNGVRGSPGRSGFHRQRKDLRVPEVRWRPSPASIGNERTCAFLKSDGVRGRPGMTGPRSSRGSPDCSPERVGPRRVGPNPHEVGP
jgi:hypothetical protein